MFTEFSINQTLEKPEIWCEIQQSFLFLTVLIANDNTKRGVFKYMMPYKSQLQCSIISLSYFLKIE